MAKRSTRARTAEETVGILRGGGYSTPTGCRVDIAGPLASATSRSALYAPDDFKDLFRGRDQVLGDRGPQPPCRFEVVNETTLQAARRLARDGERRVLALNFASARNPGGGFLNGSQAQEESLARASGLYACLLRFPQLYAANRQFPSCLYTDHMIYAPDVPVFRDDEDALLDQPYPLSILTAPAVNAGAVRKNEPARVHQIEPVLEARTEKVLSVAVVHGHDTLVLGAWGCGVFRNDPAFVAGEFARLLTGDGLFRSAFRRVVFAVLDRTADGSKIRPFAVHFGMGGSIE
jgi:uncharacterized protein (TIGR02452 family)